jgi:hypothetical protein
MRLINEIHNEYNSVMAKSLPDRNAPKGWLVLRMDAMLDRCNSFA